jgi:hypothetical protein
MRCFLLLRLFKKLEYFNRAAPDEAHQKKSPDNSVGAKSGGLDSNQRPLAPHTSALPGCATTRSIRRSFSVGGSLFTRRGCKFKG